MYKFLKKHRVYKLIQREAEDLNTTVSSKEIKFLNKSYCTRKTPGPHDFNFKFYKKLEEKNNNLTKFFQKTKAEGAFSNSFYEASKILMSKLNKNIAKTNK